MPSLSPCQQQSSEQIGCWTHRRDENSWRISSPSQQQWRKHWQLVPACQRWGQSWWHKQLLAAQRALPEVPTLSLLTVQWGLSTQPVICLPCISSERQQLKIYSEYCRECLMADFISLFFNKGKKPAPVLILSQVFLLLVNSFSLIQTKRKPPGPTEVSQSYSKKSIGQVNCCSLSFDLFATVCIMFILAPP